MTLIFRLRLRTLQTTLLFLRRPPMLIIGWHAVEDGLTDCAVVLRSLGVRLAQFLASF